MMLAVALIFGYLLCAVFFAVLANHLIEKIFYGLSGDILGAIIGVLWPVGVPIFIAVLLAKFLGNKFC